MPKRKSRTKSKQKTKSKRKSTARVKSKAARKARPVRGKAGRKPTPRRATTGEAGRRGEDVRSDLFVSVEIRPSGGLEVTVDSKVESFYGDSIRRAAASAFQKFRVKHARMHIEDRGALPLVVNARIEAALRRAGARGKLLPRAVATPPPTAKNRLRRSRLYLPGNEPKFMINAGIHKPDAVILDLEDSVHPEQKDTARILVRNALRSLDFMGAERMVRINQLPLGFEDIDEIVPEKPHLILIPKVETAEEVHAVARRIAKAQTDGKRKKHTVWLMPILESALGIENAYEIASADETVCALTIGLEDYTADLGVRKTKEGAESHFARSRLVNAARAAGIQAIDSVYGDVGDMDGLRSWGLRARAMGFEGMGCIHPRQIRVIHEAFAPTREEIDRAVAIVAAFEEAERRGLGVVSLGTRMVDPPVVLRAQRLVDVARRAGLLDE
jgi:citrate lyase subunit beta/citryl-CoA lyase